MLKKIRSTKILKNIFENIKKRMRLKILKYNKNMLIRLNINKNDFDDFIMIKKLNEEFNLDIHDIEIKILDLACKNINNKIFWYLNEIKFKKLEHLNLKGNEISKIDLLEKVNFKNFKFEKEPNIRYSNIRKG